MKIKVIDFESPSASVEFVESLAKTGFAVLKNHSIDTDLIESVYSDWEVFFRSDEKHNYKFEVIELEGVGQEHLVVSDVERVGLLVEARRTSTDVAPQPPRQAAVVVARV